MINYIVMYVAVYYNVYVTVHMRILLSLKSLVIEQAKKKETKKISFTLKNSVTLSKSNNNCIFSFLQPAL